MAKECTEKPARTAAEVGCSMPRLRSVSTAECRAERGLARYVSTFSHLID